MYNKFEVFEGIRFHVDGWNSSLKIIVIKSLFYGFSSIIKPRSPDSEHKSVVDI